MVKLQVILRVVTAGYPAPPAERIAGHFGTQRRTARHFTANFDISVDGLGDGDLLRSEALI